MKKIFLITCISFGLTLGATAQVKVGNSPTTIGTNSNLEVEATNGGKVTVTKDSSKVIIKDGSQGAGKVLTSDANGVATWQPSAASQVNFHATMTSSNTTFQAGNYNLKVNFSEVSPNVGNSFNISTDRFTAPISGIYFFIGSAYVHSVSNPGANGAWVDVLSIKVNGDARISQENYQLQSTSGYGNSFSIMYLTRLEKGDYVELFGGSSKPNPAFVGYANTINAPQTSFQGFLIGQ